MGTPRIIIDTNVLISAFGWRGNPRRIFEQVLEKRFELIVSTKQLAELARVLTYPRLRFTKEQQKRFLDILLSVAIIVETRTVFNLITADPSDNMFLESAADTRAEYIITGDTHLLNVNKFENTVILTPAAFIARIA